MLSPLGCVAAATGQRPRANPAKFEGNSVGGNRAALDGVS
jgi:hypothetical protein